MNTDKDQIEQMMENISQPNIDVSNHQKEFRLTLLSIRKSAIAGSILLVLPLLFLSGVVLKHYLEVDFGIFTSVYEWIGQVDQRYGDTSMQNWMIRLLLTLGPLTAIALNLLAVTHLSYDKAIKEIVLSFKLRWLNWLIIIVSSAIFVTFFLYLLIENT